eukprot:Skav234297  [mRNA]  locus=scaffold2271:264530:265657:+ [translate_table: standard]
MLASLLWSKSTCFVPVPLKPLYWEGLDMWQELPWNVRKDIIQSSTWDAVISCHYEKLGCTLLEVSDVENELIRACSKALSDDIELEMVGSFTRGTAAGKPDFDFDVRRTPSSERFGKAWTQEEKEKVAQEIEKLDLVEGQVIIGNKAIKFNTTGDSLHGPFLSVDSSPIEVDLVLASGSQPEEWPNLRGGNNVTENFERIHGFLERTPAARYAIMVLKCADPRPKGIVLEAIAERLWKTYKGPRFGSTVVRTQLDMALEAWRFFKYMLRMLQNWDDEESPFGSDLKEDLSMLSDQKREDHFKGFEFIRQVEVDDFAYQMLWVYVEAVASESWIVRGPSRAHLKRNFWKSFRAHMESELWKFMKVPRRVRRRLQRR